MKEREPIAAPYWTDDLALGEVALPRERAIVRLRWHQSEERVRGHEELFPLQHKTGPRLYVHARPYVLEPEITLTVGLLPIRPKAVYPAESVTASHLRLIRCRWRWTRTT